MGFVYRLSSLLAFAVVVAGDSSKHVYTDSFPKTDEYEAQILDPFTVYGSPYGGFSRATSSRLASLPLHLPDLIDGDTTDEPVYTQVRDLHGRLYVCRVFHEDELDPDSLETSMFDKPQLRDLTKADDHSSNVVEDKDSTATTVEDDSESSTVIEAVQRLRRLEGICGQIHKGWWSYEWCHEDDIDQFHIEVEQEGAEKGQVRVMDVTNLGRFEGRMVNADLESMPPNELAEDLVELARVVDVYKGGDNCPDTGRLRESSVSIQCCSERVMERRRGLIHRNQEKTPDASLIALMDIVEDPDNVCTYNVTVCTSLLCADGAWTTVAGLDVKQSPRENETVREMLDRALGTKCLQSSGGGWWTYEFCHGRNIRQYHEVLMTGKTEKGKTFTSKQMEDEFWLGVYNGEIWDSIGDGEEYLLVVNATVGGKGGSGAYLEIEYTDGDVCDHSDVTDSAVVAGSARAGGGVSRASSIRYLCGESYDLVVSEDSTCHYVVEVRVPDLCGHPLFQLPVSKKQVVKCLPVEEQVPWTTVAQ